MAANSLGVQLVTDGIIGPITLEWVNSYRNPKALLAALKVMTGIYYIGLNRQRYLAGWLSRLED
jgi:hypothetical protein